MACILLPGQGKYMPLDSTLLVPFKSQASEMAMIRAVLPVEIPDSLIVPLVAAVNHLDAYFFPAYYADPITSILSNVIFASQTWESFGTPLSHQYLIEYTALRLGEQFLLTAHSSDLSQRFVTQYRDALTTYRATLTLSHWNGGELDRQGYIDPNPTRRMPTHSSDLGLGLWQAFCKIAEYYNEHLQEYCVFNFSVR
jgi:hypothetical protein